MDDPILTLLGKRDALCRRLLKSFKYKDNYEIICILTSFLSLERLEEITKFQEEHN